MPIEYEEFTKTLKPGGFHKVGLHAIPNAHKRLVQFYCNILAVRGACSTKCAECLTGVRHELNTADWNQTASPYGLYTFILKKSAAIMVEQVHEKAAPKTPGEPVDALDMFMETLNAQ